MHSAGEIWWGLTLVWYDRRESKLTIIAALKRNYKDLYVNLSYVEHKRVKMLIKSHENVYVTGQKQIQAKIV